MRITISKSQWQKIGQEAGWYDGLDSRLSLMSNLTSEEKELIKNYIAKLYSEAEAADAKIVEAFDAIENEDYDWFMKKSIISYPSQSV